MPTNQCGPSLALSGYSTHQNVDIPFPFVVGHFCCVVNVVPAACFCYLALSFSLGLAMAAVSICIQLALLILVITEPQMRH